MDIELKLDETLNDFKLFGKDLANFPLITEVTENNKKFKIEVRKTHDGYSGFVDYSCYGGGKQLRSALNGIRRRIMFVAYNEINPSKADWKDIEARMIDEELKRRKKNWS